MKTLRQFLGLCDHQYKTIREGNMLENNDKNHVTGLIYVQQCTKCQVIRHYKIEV